MMSSAFCFRSEAPSSFLVDPLLSGAEGVAEHGRAPHEEQEQAHAVEDAKLQEK